MQNLTDLVNGMMVKEVSKEIKIEAEEHGIAIKKDNKILSEPGEEGLNKILIPKTINKLQAAANLVKEFQEEETYRDYNRSYDNFFINDFMAALGILIPKYFGMLHVSSRDTKGDPAPNDYIQIPIKYDEKGNLVTVDGYVGSIKAPCWEEAIIDVFPGILVVRAKLKFEKEVGKFLNDVEKSIKQHSVVKGNAITIEVTKRGLIAKPINPKINTSIVLSSDNERIIKNLTIPNMNHASKTSILFTGNFGTGKTETAIRVGLEAQKQFGRTFFYIHNAQTFNKLTPYIKNYQPSVIFVEDIDQISGGERDSDLNDLLNQMDGNELKNVNCTFIFTTNEHKKIHPAMRRPGRIDQVIHFDYCDNEMIAKIYAIYASGMEGAEDINFDELAEATPKELQGAIIAEISKRAVSYANRHHGGVISGDRYLDAIATMKHHIEFMREDQKKDFTLEHLLAHVTYKALKGAFPQMGMDRADWKNSPFEGLKS